MCHRFLSPHERRALVANGISAAGRRQPNFAPVIRLWLPTSPLSWLLTHTLPANDDLAYGLAVQHGDKPVFELGHWSLSAFESFAQGGPETCLRASSVFLVQAPLSAYIRALIRKKAWGY